MNGRVVSNTGSLEAILAFSLEEAPCGSTGFFTSSWREIFYDAGCPGLVFLGDDLIDYILLIESSVSARLEVTIGNTSASYLHLDHLNHRHQGSTD